MYAVCDGRIAATRRRSTSCKVHIACNRRPSGHSLHTDSDCFSRYSPLPHQINDAGNQLRIAGFSPLGAERISKIVAQRIRVAAAAAGLDGVAYSPLHCSRRCSVPLRHRRIQACRDPLQPIRPGRRQGHRLYQIQVPCQMVRNTQLPQDRTGLCAGIAFILPTV